MKLHGQGSYLLPMHNHPLVVAQNILDSSALDILECSIFLPKPSHETTLSRPLTRGEKVGGIQVGRAVGKRIKEPQMAFSAPAGKCTLLVLTYSSRKVDCLKNNIAKINYRGNGRSCNGSNT